VKSMAFSVRIALVGNLKRSEVCHQDLTNSGTTFNLSNDAIVTILGKYGELLVEDRAALEICPDIHDSTTIVPQ